MTAPTPSPVSSLDRLIATLKTEVGNLVSHAVALGSAYVVLAHVDYTKLETAITGAVAVGVGALVNKLRTSL